MGPGGLSSNPTCWLFVYTGLQRKKSPPSFDKQEFKYWLTEIGTQNNQTENHF